MTLEALAGVIRFHVQGQSALPKWQQTALRNALAKNDSPPEELRFQCRIATDARDNFSLIELNNGETLKLHYKSQPQFGKNRNGDAYLTVTMVYSGDGNSYCIKWSGDAVPRKMQQVAVKHDQGVAVRPCTIALDLAKAKITPSYKQNYQPKPPSERSFKEEAAAAQLRRAQGKPQITRARRTCRRLTESDIPA